MVRGGLVMSIFEKVLRLPEDGGTEAKATTLMISDMQQIVSGLTYLHEVWAGVLETALATYLLQRMMDISSMAMLALVVGENGPACYLSELIRHPLTTPWRQFAACPRLSWLEKPVCNSGNGSRQWSSESTPRSDFWTLSNL